MKKTLIALCTLLLSAGVNAQNFVWAVGFGGSSEDIGHSITLDDSGNVYTTGLFHGAADFDPGPGTAILTGGYLDVFVQKLDASGNFLWAKNIGGGIDDRGYSITVDASGNVYTTGYFRGIVDFDPGPDTTNLTSAGYHDVFVLKLDASGNFLWAKSFGAGGGSDDEGYSITTDASGNVYTAGSFEGTVDFDPGPGTANLTSAGDVDVFVLKLDASGNFLWAKGFGSSSPDRGYSITVDASGNVYTTGTFYGTVDFDPGPETANLTSAGEWDVFVQKLSSSGNFLWAKAFGGGGGDWGYSITLDDSGNVYTTGYFRNTGDFDPGPGTANLTSAGERDVFIQKLDASGNFLWAKGFGDHWLDQGQSIAADASGNVYATGHFYGTVDFDPGPATANLTSAGDLDVFVLKLDASGNFLWANGFGSSTGNIGYSITLDASGNVYTAGSFGGTVDFDLGPGTANLTSTGDFDVFVLKLSQCNTNSIDVIAACDNYTWIDGNTYTENNNTASHILTNAAGCDSLVYLNLTIGNSNPTVDVINDCESYTWIDGNTYTESNNTATYLLTNAAGCDSLVTLNLTIGSPNSAEDVINACESHTWIDGITYTESNYTAIHTLTNAAGCDSLVTLNLTIGSPNSAVDVINACGSYTWIDDITYTESNNTATYLLSNASGCDSLVMLNLNINPISGASCFESAKFFGGSSSDVGESIAVDASGNVFTTGSFRNTVDFDPGPGTANLTSAGGEDVFVQKLDASGNFLWAKRFGGSSADRGLSITVDASGNVYTTGYFTGTGDFDPGPATVNLTSAGAVDVFVQKLDASGNFLWAKSFGSSSYDYGFSTTVDASGNVYTTGSFAGTVDFDPGPGTANLTSAGGEDVFVQKLDASGNFLWAKRFGGSLADRGYSITADASGNIYTTGSFRNTVDFDPGPGTANLTSAGSYDVFIQKMDVSGNYLWAKSFGGSSNDYGYSTTVDASGNVHTIGYFEGTVDFDPGPGTVNLTYAGNGDVFVLKLDASGNYLWAKSFGGSSTDYGSSITADASGNVYTTGYFQGTADFDPGPGTANLTSAGDRDIFIQKLDVSGNFLWAKSFGGSEWDQGNSITTDASGNVYTTGFFRGTVDFDPGSGTTNLTSAGNEDVFVLKLTTCNTIDVIEACNSYTWIDGNTYNESNNTATYMLTSDIGCESPVTLNLTINYSPSATDTLFACDSLMWIDGITYTESNYTATHSLPNPAGCDSLIYLNLTIGSNSSVDVINACDSLTWIDGITYTESNNTATHILTNAAGCDSIITLDLTINPSSISFDIINTCDPYTWIDGITYTESNSTATYLLTTAAGCDSLVTLILTIGNPVPPGAPCFDCAGVFSGTAYVDECDTCVGGTTGLTPCTPPCQTDTNGDGIIGYSDLVALLSEFGCTSDCQYDFNGDGIVSFNDMIILLAGFGTSCDG